MILCSPPEDENGEVISLHASHVIVERFYREWREPGRPTKTFGGDVSGEPNVLFLSQTNFRRSTPRKNVCNGASVAVSSSPADVGRTKGARVTSFNDWNSCSYQGFNTTFTQSSCLLRKIS